jgi:predicted ATPase
MLTNVSIQNFRAIGPPGLSLKLRPLSVIVGPNGTGKSSILQAIALTAQSAIESPGQQDLVLDGTKIDIHEHEARQYHEERCNSIYYEYDPLHRLSVRIDINSELPLPFDWNGDKAPSWIGKTVQKWPPSTIGYQWSRMWSTHSHDALWWHNIFADSKEIFSVQANLEKIDRHNYKHTTTGSIGNYILSTIPAYRYKRVLHDEIFRGHTFQHQAAANEALDEFSKFLVDILADIGDMFREQFIKIYMITDLRNSNLMHNETGPDVDFVGKHAENTIRLLSRIQSKSRPSFSRLSEWARRFGMHDIAAGWAGENKLGVVFKDPHVKQELQLSDAASGSMQGIILATQLLLSRKGSVILIEEPENNLHPGYIRLLPELFKESINGGRQIILTTHSEYLVAAIGNSIRRAQNEENCLNQQDVIIQHLERSDSGVTQSEEINVTEQGYLHGWVKSFAEIDEELQREWYETLPKERDEDSR